MPHWVCEALGTWQGGGQAFEKNGLPFKRMTFTADMTRLVAPDGPNGADAPTLDKWGEDSGVRSLPAHHSLKSSKRE